MSQYDNHGTSIIDSNAENQIIDDLKTKWNRKKSQKFINWWLWKPKKERKKTNKSKEHNKT